VSSAAGFVRRILFGQMSSQKTVREQCARWLYVAATGVALFSVGLPLCIDTFWARWDLLFLVGLSWLLAAASFLVKPNIPAGIMFFFGLLAGAALTVFR